MRLQGVRFLLCVLLVLGAGGARALESGTNTSVIEVRSDFSGADLTIFGALENNLTQQDKIFIFIEGPKKDITLWEKQSVFGVWTNKNRKTFSAVSSFYFITSSSSVDGVQKNIAVPKPHRAVVERLLKEKNLFITQKNKVEFLGKKLFRANLRLPQSAPVGDYKVRVLHFRGKRQVEEITLPLKLNKIGWAQTLFWLAQEWAFFYGFFAVAFALFLGWAITELLRRLT